ncbi:MAG: M6 family metalloprotease domain-containing protein [Burkholderiales bacterium]|nr:M6 family metalloprotease domain-containing protein [Burkholderiales bacterium]
MINTLQAHLRAVLVASGLCAVTAGAFAVPARPVPLTLKQANGSLIQAQLKGDEYLNWMETSNGDAFLFNKNSRRYEYAVVGKINGRSALVPSGVAVGTGAVPAMAATPGVTNRAALNALWQEMRKALEVVKPQSQKTATTATTIQPKSAATANMTLSATVSGTTQQEVPLLVVLVDYTDDKIQSADSTWQQKVFGASAGTVNDYYREVSGGRFKYTPVSETQGTANDGVVHVQMNYANPIPYNQQDPQTQIIIRNTLMDILSKADAYVNFAQFDKNADGQVDSKELSVLFILGGKELAYRDAKYPDYPADSRGTWGQRGMFYPENRPVYDNVRIPEYAIVGERHGDHDATIGVMTHEIAHLTFDLPDLYDPWSNFTTWDLMAGAWGQKADDTWGGMTPPHLSAFCKIKAGFIAPAEVELMYAPNNMSLYAPLNASYNAIKILTNNTSDFMIAEQRRLEGYDRGVTMDSSLYGRYGVMIYRSDVNYVNPYPISVVHLMRANGSDDNRAGFTLTDMYYTGNNTRFAPNTTPNSTIGGVNVGAVVENIAASNGVMTLTIRRDDPNGYNCKQYVATNSAHVTANRAYGTTSGTFYKTTTYYAKGSNQNLGTSGSTSTTLKEGPAGYFVKGSCPANQKPVVQSITRNTNANITDVTIAVSDAERDLVRVEYQLDNGTWTKAAGTGNPTSGNFFYVAKFVGLANGNHQLNARAFDAAGNVSAVYGQSFTLGAASCYTATNSAHVSAGRATVKYSSLYYAIGSNNYLGGSGTTTSLQLQSTNYWKKVTSCP